MLRFLNPIDRKPLKGVSSRSQGATMSSENKKEKRESKSSGHDHHEVGIHHIHAANEQDTPSQIDEKLRDSHIMMGVQDPSL